MDVQKVKSNYLFIKHNYRIYYFRNAQTNSLFDGATNYQIAPSNKLFVCAFRKN
jgi:3-phenylpropionate/cinnamic acid dioxygenase small subunit